MTEVTVVVPAWKAAGTLATTLRALEAQDLDTGHEVVVVYDPHDRATAAIAREFPELRWVERPPGLGAGEARNLGAGAANGRVLAFTDADCEPQPGWLREGLAAIERAELVQGAVRPDPGEPRTPFDHTVWIGHATGLFETANLFVTRELFERLGGFQDWLEVPDGRPFGEDVVFGWRARRSGAAAAFCETAIVHHAVTPRPAGAFVAEQRRRGLFADLVAQVPELRDEFLYRRYFLSRRTAAFDAAAAGAAVALAARSSLPLAAALPYLILSASETRHWGRGAPRAIAVQIAGDAVGFAALLAASVRRGTPVL